MSSIFQLSNGEVPVTGGTATDNEAMADMAPTAYSAIDSFRDAMASSGINPPDHIEADGQLHRFSTNGKSGDTSGYYCLHLDNSPAGHFGCWRSLPEGRNWSARNGETLDRQERQRISKAIEDAKEQRRAHKAKRAEDAQRIWDAATEAKGSHGYLMQKGVRAAGEMRVCNVSRAEFFDDETKSGTLSDYLLVKVEGETGLQSLQAISPDGRFKAFMSGGEVSNGCNLIHGTADTVYVVEGLATGLTVHAATGATVAVSFNSNNMVKVANRMKREAPGASLVIAGDNDHASNDNPGRKAAEQAASETGATVCLPHFSPEETGSDWNDLHALRNLDAVGDGLTAPQDEERHRLQDVLENSKARHLLNVEPPKQQFVVDGMIPEPVAAGVVAPGGTGKSFWLMQLAACITTGTPFMGQTVSRPGSVLMLGAEDDRDELSRRLHSIVNEHEWDGEPLDREVLGNRFHPMSLVGQDNRLINEGERNEARISGIIEMARQIEDLRLIILDPVSRFRAGEENSNDDNTRFAEVLEHIRHETGVTVLVAHHARKGSNGDSADDIRGGSAFSDALRFVVTLSSPDREQAKSLGIDREEARSLIRYRVVKSNYHKDVEELWFRRGKGGVLKLTDTPAEQPSRSENKGEERYNATLSKLRDLVRQKDEAGDPLTRSKLRRQYGGTSNVFGVSKSILEDIANRAIEEGQIFVRDSGALHLY